MTLDIGWYLENKIAFQKLHGEFVASEFQESADVIIDWFSQISGTAHLIVDNTDLDSLPRIQDLTGITPAPNTGWIVVVGVENRVIKFVSSVAIQALRLKFHFADTVEEAHAFLRERVSELEPYPEPLSFNVVQTFDHLPITD